MLWVRSGQEGIYQRISENISKYSRYWESVRGGKRCAWYCGRHRVYSKQPVYN